jgi:CRP-like cAMP-binding protein
VGRYIEPGAGGRPVCTDCKARPFAAYGGLASSDAHAIELIRRDVRQIKAKRIIHRERETLDAVYTLREGWAFRFRLLADGRRQILSFLLPGSPIGLPLYLDARTNFSVQALTDVTLCVFGRAELAAFFGSVANGPASLESCYANLCRASDERLVDLGRRNARERIASLILGLHARMQLQGQAVEGAFHFPLRRQHIADALGLTPVHVGRVLGQLAADKLIALDRDTLTVLDERSLADLAR